MAHSLIFTRLLKIISNRRAENAKRPGKPAFPDFQCHFHEHEGRLDWWTSRASRSRAEASSDEARAVVSHPVEPALPIPIGRRIDRPQQGLPNGFYAGETKDAPFEPAQPVRSKEGSVYQRRHTHRDDELRRPSGKQPPRKPCLL
jgi:hypothetical protein